MERQNDKARPRQDIKDIARTMAANQGSVSAGQVAQMAKVTRQAAFYHLRALADAGELRIEGRGRGARYVPVFAYNRAAPLAGLQEDLVWRDLRDAVPGFRDAAANVRSILNYAFTEMLNNAIEHSEGTEARILAGAPSFLVFDVIDNGVGVFERVKQQWDLPDVRAAVLELQKGKRTSDPARHSGQGIFFTSKVVDLFVLEGNGLRWGVDNLRNDFALGDSAVSEGTRVHVEVDPSTTRTAKQVFEVFSDEDLEFARSAISLRLLETGSDFVSRSEAKRLSAGLEEFEKVVLDFERVSEVGQGFVDELFRVWAREHPMTELVPANMGQAVDFMVRRAQASADKSS